MIDLKIVLKDPDAVRTAIRNKNEKRDDIDRICELAERRRALQTEIGELRRRVNECSRAYGNLKKEGKDDPDLLKESRETGDRAAEREKEDRAVEAELRELLAWIPNLPDAEVPVGPDESANRLLREWGERRKFSFAPRPHWDIATDLGLADFERAPRIAGANFLLLKGAGARIERALIQFMLDLHTREHGYTEIWPPVLSGPGPMTGSAQLPKLEADMYRLRDDDLYLIPTAEVPLTNLHGGEILSEEDLPVRYTAYSPCFRREAGAYGRETRGMIRVHQFDKVELLRLSHPDRSAEEHEALTAEAEKVLQLLGLPYRVVLLCTGDLSFASSKTYDIEVWAPGIDRWLEVSSCSNFLDFQARRANLRFRGNDKKVRHLHTLNGSGLALPRTVVALLENGQQEDGSVLVPEPLRPYLGGIEKIEKS